MSTFEWVVSLLVVLPLGVFLWLCFILILANLPNYMRTMLTTAKLARLKSNEQTK